MKTQGYLLIFCLLTILACEKKVNNPVAADTSCRLSEMKDLKSNVNEVYNFSYVNGQLDEMEINLVTSYIQYQYFKCFYNSDGLYKITNYIDRGTAQNTGYPDSAETIITYDKTAGSLEYVTTEYLDGSVSHLYPVYDLIITQDTIFSKIGDLTLAKYVLDNTGNIKEAIHYGAEPEVVTSVSTFKFDKHPSPFKPFPTEFKLVYIDWFIDRGYVNNVTQYHTSSKFDNYSGSNTWKYYSNGMPVMSENWEYSYIDCR